MLLQFVYGANVIVAGFISITSLFYPKLAASIIFSNAYPETETTKLVGCLWLAIALLSVAGLYRPLPLSPILVVQLIYKTCWLLFVCIPAILQNRPYPGGMAAFFIAWVLVLPFVIPWSYLLRG